MGKNVLVSWVGHADLKVMSRSETAKNQKQIEAIVDSGRKIQGEGPLKTLVDGESFDKIHLINSYGTAVQKMIKKWIGPKAVVHNASITNPTDHSQILGIVQPILDGLKLKPSQELCFHLSPGTPAMAAIWILLAKSKFPATLFQTFAGNVSKASVPFDVTVEVVPQLLSEPDRFWQHLVDEGPEEIPGFSKIIGDSQELKMAVGRAKRAAIFDVTVLILGESGTGKEMFGKAIHEASHRRGGPMVSINCAAISKELLESELFGHVKGAFTGADQNRKGAFEQADGGTLFLDEVGECDLAMQAKILRAMQPPSDASPSHRVFRKVGATSDTHADVRIVAATNRDLSKQIADGDFREDLYYRLAMITVKLPSLRKRKGDVGLLAKSLLNQINDEFDSHSRPGFVRKSLPSETVAFLENYHWPGNVRELYNVLIQAAIMQDNARLKPRDIAAALASVPGGISKKDAAEVVLGDGFVMKEYLDDIQASIIRRALEESGGVKSKASELLGIKNYQTLDAQMNRLKI